MFFFAFCPSCLSRCCPVLFACKNTERISMKFDGGDHYREQIKWLHWSEIGTGTREKDTTENSNRRQLVFRRDVRLCPFVYRTFLLAMATRIRQTITTAGAEASYFRERFLTLCLNIVLSQLIFFVRIWNISLLFLYLLLLLLLLLMMSSSSSSSSFSVTYYYYKCLRSTLHSPFRHWPAGFWRP